MALRGKAHNANTSSSSSVTVPVSSIGIQAGDTVVFSVCAGGGNTNPASFPTGFVPLTISGTVGLDVNSTNTFSVAIKIATGTEPTSYAASVGSADFLTGAVRVYSGRDPTTPVRAYSGVQSQYAFPPPTGTYSLVNVSGILAGDDVVQVFGNRFYEGYSLTYAPYTGFGNGEIDYAGSTTYSPVVAGADWVGYTGGTLGLNAGTITTSDSNAQGYAGYVIVLASAPAPPSVATYNVPRKFGPGVSPDYLKMFQHSVRGYSNPTTNVTRGLSGLNGTFTQATLISPTISGGKSIALAGVTGIFSQGIARRLPDRRGAGQSQRERCRVRAGQARGVLWNEPLHAALHGLASPLHQSVTHVTIP